MQDQEKKMNLKNYTQVLIDGKVFTLGGSEDEGYLQKAAGYVNEKIAAMRKLPGFTKQSADYQMAMIELNMADDYFKALEKAGEMESQKNTMEKETYSLKHELVGTQMKLEAVLKDLEDRQRQLEELIRKTGQLERMLRNAQTRGEGADASEDKEVSETPEVRTAEEESRQEAYPEQEQPEQAVPEQSVTRVSSLSDEELAKKALQAAKKAGGHRGGRR